MKAGLYDSVRVHGPQGGEDGTRTAKAYACTNCMEFFAELSTAYHWAPAAGGDTVLEYNKWFPFNRHQLQQHDPETVVVLRKYWTLHEIEGDGEQGGGENENMVV